jgi:hypothetical protein
MASLTSNRASNAPSELRLRLTRDAVLAAYINEISEHARPSGGGARRETARRASTQKALCPKLAITDADCSYGRGTGHNSNR